VDLFSPTELAEIREYHRAAYLLSAFNLLVWPVLVTLLALWAPRPLYALSTRLTARWKSAALSRVWRSDDWGAAIVFSLLYYWAFDLLALPQVVWFGFVQEHRYGMSTMSFGTFVGDQLKSYALAAIAVASLAFGLFGLARRLPSWWVVMAVVATVAMSASALLDPYRERIFIEQVPLADGPLRTRITETMRQAKIDFLDVLVDKSSSRTVRLQAYFAGSGPTRTIVLNDALVANLTDDEAIAAVAHEAGHVGEARWVGRGLAAVALVVFLFVIEWIFRRSAARGWFGITQRADIRALPLILLVFDVATWVADPLSAAAARRAEWRADRFALELTHNPEAFRSMLTKVARVNKMDPDPPWWIALYQSHPPISARIAAAK
jgi:STE24 endopeptidase